MSAQIGTAPSSDTAYPTEQAIRQKAFQKAYAAGWQARLTAKALAWEAVTKEVAPSETSSGGTGKLHLPPKPKNKKDLDEPGDFTWKQGYTTSSESSKTSVLENETLMSENG